MADDDDSCLVATGDRALAPAAPPAAGRSRSRSRPIRERESESEISDKDPLCMKE